MKLKAVAEVERAFCAMAKLAALEKARAALVFGDRLRLFERLEW